MSRPLTHLPTLLAPLPSASRRLLLLWRGGLGRPAATSVVHEVREATSRKLYPDLFEVQGAMLLAMFGPKQDGEAV